MRRTAYDLDVLISRAPRHIPGATIGGNSVGVSSTVPVQTWQGRLDHARTPANRTPAPNELEYLDVFDFFNVPRSGVGAGIVRPDGMAPAMTTGAGGVSVPGQFNITDYLVDQSRDWLSFQAEGAKFVG
jgi:hypothetical protein